MEWKLTFATFLSLLPSLPISVFASQTFLLARYIFSESRSQRSASTLRRDSRSQPSELVSSFISVPPFSTPEPPSHLLLFFSFEDPTLFKIPPSINTRLQIPLWDQ